MEIRSQASHYGTSYSRSRRWKRATFGSLLPKDNAQKRDRAVKNVTFSQEPVPACIRTAISRFVLPDKWHQFVLFRVSVNCFPYPWGLRREFLNSTCATFLIVLCRFSFPFFSEGVSSFVGGGTLRWCRWCFFMPNPWANSCEGCISGWDVWNRLYVFALPTNSIWAHFKDKKNVEEIHLNIIFLCEIYFQLFF